MEHFLFFIKFFIKFYINFRYTLYSILLSYLEHREHCDGERVEVWWRRPVRKVEGSSEQLHAEQRKDEDEEEEQQQQGDDGLHRAQQGDHQVAEGRPVTGN